MKFCGAQTWSRIRKTKKNHRGDKVSILRMNFLTDQFCCHFSADTPFLMNFFLFSSVKCWLMEIKHIKAMKISPSTVITPLLTIPPNWWNLPYLLKGNFRPWANYFTWVWGMKLFLKVFVVTQKICSLFNLAQEVLEIVIERRKLFLESDDGGMPW